MTHHLAIAENYYQAMNEKDLAKVKSYLRHDAKLISPLAGEAQTDSIVGALAGFMNSFLSLKIRAKCSSENQVMLAIDVEYPSPIGTLKAAVLMTFKDNQIASTELFHDTKPFENFNRE